MKIIPILAMSLSIGNLFAEDSRGPDLHVNIQGKDSFTHEFQVQTAGEEQQRILNQVTELLKKNYSRYHLGIKIEDRVVTLTGAVKNTDDILDIENAVRRIPGVAGVNNRLSSGSLNHTHSK